jgi:hypothetical protein
MGNLAVDIVGTRDDQGRTTGWLTIDCYGGLHFKEYHTLVLSFRHLWQSRLGRPTLGIVDQVW